MSDNRCGGLDEDDWFIWYFHIQFPGMISVIQADADYLGWFNWWEDFHLVYIMDFFIFQEFVYV